ncbi:MAG: acyl-CoA/acyl-ACP dehydrogenase [Desulfobacterales bacterium]|nr:acyl-CoA/acyl-ACP dehydrogenase [Desulfobacterales bacterium]
MIPRSECKAFLDREPKFDDIMISLRAIARQPKGINSEVKRIIAVARKFNDEVVRPGCLPLDRKMHEDPDHLAWDYVIEANKRGFYTMFIPKMFGGGGYSLAGIAYFLEELASACGAIANIVGVHYLGVTMLFSSWNFKVINRVCKDVVKGYKEGKPCILSLAMTEPDAGTDSQNIEFMDTGSLACHAQKVPGGYKINGNKIFISMGHMSTWHIIHAYTDLNRASENTVMLAVKTGTRGFTFGKKEKKMGQKACPASELIFKDCFVPDENVCIDKEDASRLRSPVKDTNARIFAFIWAASRTGVGAFGVGTARAAFEDALAYAAKTEIDGQLLVNHEWCQSLLADMYKNVLLSRLAYAEASYANGLHGMWMVMNLKPMYYMTRYTPAGILKFSISALSRFGFVTNFFRKICFDHQKDEAIDRIDGWGSLAKVVGTDAGITNARLALEIMGHAGVRQDCRAEKVLRDSKLLQIYEGTNQINRLNLFKRMVAKPIPQAEVFSQANL